MMRPRRPRRQSAPDGHSAEWPRATLPGGDAAGRLSCLRIIARRPPGVGHPSGTNGAETPHLARKPNYDFEKRRKEIDRKAKKDAKREERLQRKKENAENGTPGVDPDLEGIVLGPQPGMNEDEGDAEDDAAK